MPDTSDVEKTLVETVAEILSPVYSSQQWYQPETIFTTSAVVKSQSGSNVNVRARLFRGWPVPNNLQTDLKNGVSEISVFSVPGMTRLVSKYLNNEYVVACTPITLTVDVVNNTAKFGGYGTIGQITGIAVGDGNIKNAYCIRLSENDTPLTVATQLAAIIPNASLSGTTITVSGVTGLLAGVAGDSTVNFESGMISQMYDVHIWSPNPQSRDALGSMITSGMSQELSLPFSDGSTSEITYYRGVWVNDAAQATTEWHRYQRYEVIYPVVVQTITPGLLFLGIRLNDVKLIGAFDYRLLLDGNATAASRSYGVLF